MQGGKTQVFAASAATGRKQTVPTPAERTACLSCYLFITYCFGYISIDLGILSQAIYYFHFCPLIPPRCTSTILFPYQPHSYVFCFFDLI